MRFGLLGAAALSAAGVMWIAVGPAPADEKAAPALRAAQQLVSETMTDGFVQQLAAQSWPAIEPALRKAIPEATDQAIEALRADYVRIVSQHTTMLMAATPEIFAKYFSAQELREMLAFYRSPVGVKALKLMPQVVGETSQMSSAVLPVVTAEINDAFRQALKTKGVKLGI